MLIRAYPEARRKAVVVDKACQVAVIIGDFAPRRFVNEINAFASCGKLDSPTPTHHNIHPTNCWRAPIPAPSPFCPDYALVLSATTFSAGGLAILSISAASFSSACAFSLS